MLHEDVNYDYFEYVVVRKEQDRICFGSARERKITYPTTATPENVDPTTYNIDKLVKNKPRSKRGMPGLANTAQRNFFIINSISPPPCKYALMKYATFKQSCAPFNSTSPKLGYQRLQEGPGPTDYNPHKVNKCKRTRFYYNFGRPCMVPATEIICINYPNKKCEKCSEPFEYGDFWHKNYAVYLCAFCIAEEHRLHELYTRKELLTFKKIRTCTFMHRHEGTSAAIRLISPSDKNKKLRIENYLSLFMQCYGTKIHPEGGVANN